MAGGGSAPKPDPRIGEAALRTAEIGENYMDWMKGQAKITNAWADEDRDRYKQTFEPLQDEFIAEAQAYDTPARREKEATSAVADVRQQAEIAEAASDRKAMAQGIDPRSGRYADTTRRRDMDTALASAGAGNMARRRVEDTGRALRADAVNMGSGFAVNPATSIGISNSATGSGASAAMRGNQQMGDMLNQDYQNRYSAYQDSQANKAGIFGAIGTAAGAMPWATILSSKEAKTDREAAPGILEALEDVPVDKWRYKDGMGDGGEHVGPMAEDFQKATGLGDGKTINVVDAVGITMGGLKELNEKVDKLAANTAGKTPTAPKRPKGGVGIAPEAA